MRLEFIFYSFVGFLCGSIMYSYFLPKLLFGTDIIDKGEDGNPGSANVFQHVGKRMGFLCLFCDIQKGFVPVFIASQRLDVSNPWFAVIMVAPVLGHAFSPFLKGKGGKAIATAFGVLLGMIKLSPMVLCLALLLIFFSIVIKITPHGLRMIVSLTLFSSYCVLHIKPLSFALGGILVSSVVIYKHITNFGHEKVKIRLLLLDKYSQRKKAKSK